jgi:hypothetical protein
MSRLARTHLFALDAPRRMKLTVAAENPFERIALARSIVPIR